MCFLNGFVTMRQIVRSQGINVKENTLKIGPGEINADVATKAECDAVDHRFTFAPAGY